MNIEKHDSNITISVIKKQAADTNNPEIIRNLEKISDSLDKIEKSKSSTVTKFIGIISIIIAAISAIIAAISAYYSSQSAKASQEITSASIEHHKKSVQPLLTLFPKGEQDVKEYGLYLSNQGVGPAKITSIKVNNQIYSKIDSMDWLNLFFKAEVESQKINKNYHALSLEKQKYCEPLLESSFPSNIDSIKKENYSDLSKVYEIKHLQELKPFFIDSCVNSAAANSSYYFWDCLKVGSIKNGSIIRIGDTEKLLEVKHSRLDDDRCTKDIVGFSRWLIDSGFEIEYESPLYPDKKGVVRIHDF